MSGLVDDVGANARLAVLFDEFVVSRKPQKPSKHTVKAWRSDFTAISQHLGRVLDVPAGDVRLGQLSARVLRHAFAEFSEDRAPSTVARAWSAWNQLFTFLVAEELVEGNPMAAITKPKIARRSPKPLQGEDTVDRLIEFLTTNGRKARDPWPELDLAFIVMDLLTGLRLDELLGSDIGSIDGRAGERRIKVFGKGSKERFVPIEEPLEAVLASYLQSRQVRFPSERLTVRSPLFVNRQGDRLTVGAAQYLVKACFEHAGIGARVPKGALVHALRHTFATRLAEDGASASEIQHLLGHASLNTSQGYIDSTANEQRNAARSNRTYQTLTKLLPHR